MVFAGYYKFIIGDVRKLLYSSHVHFPTKEGIWEEASSEFSSWDLIAVWEARNATDWRAICLMKGRTFTSTPWSPVLLERHFKTKQKSFIKLNENWCWAFFFLHGTTLEIWQTLVCTPKLLHKLSVGLTCGATVFLDFRVPWFLRLLQPNSIPVWASKKCLYWPYSLHAANEVFFPPCNEHHLAMNMLAFLS